METNSSSWVFPLVKRLVTFFYYVVLIALIIFSLMSSLKLLNAQTGSFSLGEEPPNYISVPVAWDSSTLKTLPSSGEPRVFLKSQKQTGQLQVPIRSTVGLLMIAMGLVGLITAGVTFYLLRRIFISVQLHSPFQVDNVRRITIMGFLFLGQTLVELLLKLALWHQTRSYLQQILLNYQDYLNVDINPEGPWLLGLILLALAQVYRRGIELQLENELTV